MFGIPFTLSSATQAEVFFQDENLHCIFPFVTYVFLQDSTVLEELEGKAFLRERNR